MVSDTRPRSRGIFSWIPLQAWILSATLTAIAIPLSLWLGLTMQGEEFPSDTVGSLVLLSFVFTLPGALPVILLLTLSVLLIRRHIPQLADRPILAPLLLALVGGAAAVGMSEIMMIMTSMIPFDRIGRSGALLLVLPGPTIGGMVAGIIMSKMLERKG